MECRLQNLLTDVLFVVFVFMVWFGKSKELVLLFLSTYREFCSKIWMIFTNFPKDNYQLCNNKVLVDAESLATITRTRPHVLEIGPRVNYVGASGQTAGPTV
jgi:hypothetical protein